MSDFDSAPASITHAIADPGFNGILIEGFACGMYTLLGLQTILKVYNKGGKLLYSSALVILWISTLVGFISDWTTSRAAFVASSSSPLAIITKIIAAESLFGDISTLLARAISDAIIIWRCNVLWQSKIILTVLAILLCTSTGFGVYEAWFPNASVSELISALSVLSSFVTTVSATFLITLKIFLVTRQTHRHHHYSRVIEILTQSGALLSVVLLGLPILYFVDFASPFDLGSTSGRFFYQLWGYLVVALPPITGIAPTLISFRVARGGSRRDINSTI